MKKLLLAVAVLLGPTFAFADDPAYFKAGPLSLTIPLKTVAVTYLYDFNLNRNLVGGETPFAGLLDNPDTVEVYDPKIEGTLGAVTSLEGAGTPFVGGNIHLGNVLEKYISLPPDLSVGGYGGFDFNAEVPIYGLKASVKLW